MAKDFLTTAAFAKLCRTTKATLLHYDHIGLLKPRLVMENGYRAYGFEQFFTFYLIDLLKKTGSGLREIAAFLRQDDRSVFLDLLREKLRFVQEERQRLARREAELQSMLAAGQEAINLDYDNVLIGWQKEERLEVVTTSISEGLPEEQSSSTNFSRLLQVVGNGEMPPRPYGSILDMELFARGRFVERHYFCAASASTPEERLWVRPEGQYATIAHIGNNESQIRAIRQLYEGIRERGYEADGVCYCYDMLSTELFDSTAQLMAGKYVIRIWSRNPSQA